MDHKYYHNVFLCIHLDLLLLFLEFRSLRIIYNFLLGEAEMIQDVAVCSVLMLGKINNQSPYDL